MFRPPTALLLLVFCATSPVAAQTLRGRLTGEAAGAIVQLLDSSQTQVARVLASPLGSYLLTAPHDGRYTLRVLRVGFPAWSSKPIALAAGSPAELSLALPVEALVLEDLTATTNSSCRSGREEGGAAATLLEEIGKAVGSAELAIRDREFRFQVRRFTRRTDLRNATLESDSSVSLINTWPVHSLSAQRLRDHGFIQRRSQVEPELLETSGPEGLVWFGPDATTLFAGPFIETHCFRALPMPNDSTRVRLAFKVIHGRRTPDIEGELWLGRQTLRLETLEFHYVNVPSGLPRTGAGGQMEFVRLPSGLWLVSHWSLRAPIQRYQGSMPAGIAGWSEEGGDITEIRGDQGAVVYSRTTQ